MSRTRRSPGFASADRAVSPVVGAVLTMAITVGAIVVIMMWGIPTLQSSRAQAAVDGVVAEMKLLGGLTDDLAESGGGVTGDAVFSYGRGGMTLEPGGDRWVVSYGLDGTTAIRLADVGDDDADYTLQNVGSSTMEGVVVQHARVTDDGHEVLGEEDVGNVTAGGSADVTVRDPSDASVPIEETFLRIRVYEFSVGDGALLAEAWILDAGAVRYELSAAAGFHQVRLSNGAVVVDEPAGSRIEELDAVRHLEGRSGEDPRVFVDLERLTPGPDASTTAGSGDWQLKAVSTASRTVTGGSTTANDLDVRVLDRSELWSRFLYLEHARPGTESGYDLVSPFDELDDGIHLDGPTRLSVFYHHVRFPSGFQAS